MKTNAFGKASKQRLLKWTASITEIHWNEKHKNSYKKKTKTTTVTECRKYTSNRTMIQYEASIVSKRCKTDAIFVQQISEFSPLFPHSNSSSSFVDLCSIFPSVLTFFFFKLLFFSVCKSILIWYTSGLIISFLKCKRMNVSTLILLQFHFDICWFRFILFRFAFFFYIFLPHSWWSFILSNCLPNKFVRLFDSLRAREREELRNT